MPMAAGTGTGGASMVVADMLWLLLLEDLPSAEDPSQFVMEDVISYRLAQGAAASKIRYPGCPVRINDNPSTQVLVGS